MKKLTFTGLFLIGCFAVQAQLQPSKMTPESSELWEPAPRVVNTSAMVPSDAIVLFDGKNFDNWVSGKDGKSPVGWTIADNAMTVKKGAGEIQTKQEFESFQLHIEWRSPAEVKGNGQGRGNSGIFLQGIYELQVLDSYNNPTYVNGQAGSIYKQTMPLVNATKQPGEWQVYDVIYTAPRFNKDGQMATPAFVTVIHNGVVIHNHTAIQGTTPYVGRPTWTPHGKGPLKLQDHGDAVSFRNIWVREL